MSRSKAIVMLLLASVLWSTGGLLIKLVDWNPVAIAGTRSGISALFMLFYLLVKHNRKNAKASVKAKFKIKITKIKIIGAFIYASTVILFVVANKMTEAANVILLQYTAPIWVALFSGVILKEKVRKVDWVSVAFVMGGMGLFFIGDISQGQMLGNILAIFSGVALAGVIFTLKLQEEGTAVEMTFLGNLVTFIIGIPFMMLSVPSSMSILGLILLGVFQLGLSYIFFAEAVSNVTALEAILIPVVEPLLNPVWVFLFDGEMPVSTAIVGGIVVVMAVVLRSVYVVQNEKKVKAKSLAS